VIFGWMKVGRGFRMSMWRIWCSGFFRFARLRALALGKSKGFSGVVKMIECVVWRCYDDVWPVFERANLLLHGGAVVEG